MHVLILHQIFVTPNQGGGTRHFEFAKHLVAKGHRVTVIGSRIDYATAATKPNARENIDGIDIRYARAYASVNKSLGHRLASFISFAGSSFFGASGVKGVDVIWATSPPLMQVLTAVGIARLKRTPLVYEMRDLWADTAHELGIVKSKLLWQALMKMEARFFDDAKKVIVNSPGFIPAVTEHVPRSKVELIPNGVTSADFEVDAQSATEFRQHHDLLGKFVVLYLGNIGIMNDIETIIDAGRRLREHSDVVILLVGNGVRAEESKRVCAEEQLTNVRFLAPVPKKDIAPVLAAADVCLATLRNTPLLEKTFPNKVFDYMASAKPTILAIDGVMREVIEAAGGGVFVKPGDAGGIAEAVLTYRSDRERAEREGAAARSYVKQHFERAVWGDRLEAVLLEAAGLR